jgi:probable HAF family extracellular repeat protein
VGGAGTTIPLTPTSNGFVCGGLDGVVPFVNHAFQWHNGNLDDLGALPGGNNCSVATSINARGEIAGTSENGAFDPSLDLNELRAVVWKDGHITDLGTLGGHHSAAVGINKPGQIAGAATNAIPDPFSLLYQLANSPNGTQTRAFFWDNVGLHDLGTLGGPDAVAIALNDNGQVAGFSYTNSTSNLPVPPFQPGLPTIHPFVWTQEDGMRDLGSLGGTVGWVNCECGGFNNRGQLIGISTLRGDQVADPFLWDGSKLIDLFTDSTGGSPISPNDISDAGEIVGGASFPDRPFDAFLWKNGLATDLGTVDGDGCSWARAINSRGQVVGQSFACDGRIVHAFLWEDGSIVDLNALIPSSTSMRLVDPLSINDRGEIAGIGLPAGCTLAIGDTTCGHAFVLIPCEGEHPGEEGCEGDSGDATITSIQSGPALPNHGRGNLNGVGLTGREIAARMQMRFGRKQFQSLPRQ